MCVYVCVCVCVCTYVCKFRRERFRGETGIVFALKRLTGECDMHKISYHKVNLEETQRKAKADSNRSNRLQGEVAFE